MNIITEKQLLTDKIVEAIQDTKGEDIMVLIFQRSKIQLRKLLLSAPETLILRFLQSQEIFRRR